MSVMSVHLPWLFHQPPVKLGKTLYVSEFEMAQPH